MDNGGIAAHGRKLENAGDDLRRKSVCVASEVSTAIVESPGRRLVKYRTVRLEPLQELCRFGPRPPRVRLRAAKNERRYGIVNVPDTREIVFIR